MTTQTLPISQKRVKPKRKVHPNSLKNLKPFQPGVSGHPGRTPKDVSLTSLLKKYMEEVPEVLAGGKKNSKTWRELLVEAWIVGAYKGNSVLFKELIDRLEGKVLLQVGGKDGGPIEFREVTELTDEQLSAIIAAGEIVKDHTNRCRTGKVVPKNGSKPSD